jgi:hypothetical protein
LIVAILAIIIIAVLIYAQGYVLRPQHGMGQFRPGEDVKFYDSDKKQWVSEAEWLRKYIELPIGYLSKGAWDKKKRDNQ